MVAKAYVEGPRWADMRKILFTFAQKNDIEIDITVDKGWFRHTWYYTVSGKVTNLIQFDREFQGWMKEVNKD